MDNFGVAESVINKHKRADEEIREKIQASYDAAVDTIRKQTENKKDAWAPIVSSRFNFGDNGYQQRMLRQSLIYELQSNPNLVSKFEPKGANNKKLLLKMQPYAFRWVEADEKRKLGFRGLCVKNLTDKHVNFLSERMQKYRSAKIDILRCFAQLIAEHADEGWIQLNLVRIALRSSLPIEKAILAMQELIDNQCVIVGTFYDYKSKRQLEAKTKSDDKKRKTHYAVTVVIGNDQMENTRKKQAEDPKALAKLVFEFEAFRSGHQNVVDFSKVLSDTKKISDNMSVPESAKASVLDQVGAFHAASQYVHAISLLKKDNEEISQDKEADKQNSEFDAILLNIVHTFVSKQVEKWKKEHGLLKNQIAELEKKCKKLNKQAEAAQKERDDALFKRNKVSKALEKYSEENTELRQKLDKVEASKVSLSRENQARKRFNDAFSMNAQEQLMILRRRIGKLAMDYTDKPRYEQMKEMTAAKFTDDISKTAEEISQKIIDFQPDSDMPPDLIR